MTEPGPVQALKAAGGTGPWHEPIDLSLPCWKDYRRLILHLGESCGAGAELPTVRQLQRLVPADAINGCGRPVTLVPGGSIPGIRYEEHIFRTGEIPTRENNWHDLFNALVWARFPRLKSAMNVLHCREIGRLGNARRGRLRDALTLFDECGVIVAGAGAKWLRLLAERDWQAVFLQHPSIWQREIRIFVCGHALLEKFLRPYKAVTAHALLLCLGSAVRDRRRAELRRLLDGELAGALRQGGLFDSPAGLSPLPLMGIPDWWPNGPQDAEFYSDEEVFRRAPDGFAAPPVFDLPVTE